MKRSIFFLNTLLIGFSSCEINQNENPSHIDSEVVNEVRAVLQGKLFSPAGMIKSKDNYQADENGIHVRNIYYYDEKGILILTLGIYEGGHRGQDWINDGDTLGAVSYHYLAGNLIEERSFDFKNGEYILGSSIYYTYDDSGKIFKIMNYSKELMITHYYNELDQLVFKKYGKNQEGEVDEFWYNEQGQLSRHIYWGGTAPIFDHFFHYNAQGWLVKKETWSGPDNKEDVFRYFYNEKGQLIEELEFYPQYNFEQRFKRVYSYFPDESTE